MSTLLGILVFAALFAAFGMLGTALARKGCEGEGHGCASCGNADACALHALKEL